MTPTWRGRTEPAFAPLTATGWVRACGRLLVIAGIVLATAVAFLPARAAENVLRRDRPWSLAIASRAFAAILRAMGLHRIVHGRPEGSALVANHSSWLDVAALFAAEPLIFVSKAEVAGWPLIGPMTRLCGTLYIERRRSGASEHREALERALEGPHRVAFFPEGTSSDGRRVLPFRTTLFAAFTGAERAAGMAVQPVGIAYRPPAGRPDHFYAWWGDMPFGAHALQVLAAPPGGAVTVRYGEPIPARGDRKALARELEASVRLLAFGLSPPSPPEGA